MNYLKNKILCSLINYMEFKRPFQYSFYRVVNIKQIAETGAINVRGHP